MLEVFLFFYKGYGLFYPPNQMGLESFILCMFAILQFTRIFLGSIGNKTENPSKLLWFIIIMIFEALGYIYFMRV